MDVPGELDGAWHQATRNGDPLAALEAVAQLRLELSRWEAMLAREALARGESWNTIGTALGTSRQAAWERLRPTIKGLIDADRKKVEQEKARVRQHRKSRT